MKIIHLYPRLDNIGGAQTLVVTVYQGMKNRGLEAGIASFTPYDKLNSRYVNRIDKQDYVQISFSFFLKLKRWTLISHHRKLTSLLMLKKKLFLFDKMNLVHVAHNEFFNLRFFSLFPSKVIAVSEKVKLNLVSFFKLRSDDVKVIYNGIANDSTYLDKDNLKIKAPLKILYPARITPVKRQLDLVRAVKKHNLENVQFIFCGDGTEYDALLELIEGDSRFIAKGLVNDMSKEFLAAHLVLLYTKKEGLPLSLIEACKYGLPIICNGVGGNKEIVKENSNGYIVDSYPDLIEKLEFFKNINQAHYSDLCTNSRAVFENKFREDIMLTNYINYVG